MENEKTLSDIIQEAADEGHDLRLVERIKSGKEATVYRVVFDGRGLAMKVYADPERRAFDNAGAYLQNRFYKTRSHARAVAKGGKFGQKLRHQNWIKREFYLLEKLHERGAAIPEPVALIGPSILMEFIGDEQRAAPSLTEVELTKAEAERAWRDIVRSVKLFWDEGVVHADLSAFNVLWWRDKPVIIDFPQAVDRRTHPDAESLLRRDVGNMARYFNKYFAIDEAAIFQTMQTNS